MKYNIIKALKTGYIIEWSDKAKKGQVEFVTELPDKQAPTFNLPPTVGVTGSTSVAPQNGFDPMQPLDIDFNPNDKPTPSGLDLLNQSNQRARETFGREPMQNTLPPRRLPPAPQPSPQAAQQLQNPEVVPTPQRQSRSGAGFPFNVYGQIGRNYSRDMKEAGRQAGLALDEEEKAIQAKIESTQRLNQDLAQLNEQRNAEIAQENQRMKNLEQVRQKLRDDKLREVEAAGNEVKNWKMQEMSVGQKLMAGIAGALISLSASRVGGNPAVGAQVVQSKIDEHLSKQKMQYERLRAGLSDKMNQYALLRQRLDDERMADDVFRAQMLEEYQGAIQERTLRANSDEAKVTGQGLLAELQGKRAEVDARINEVVNNHAMQMADRTVDSYYKQQALNLDTMRTMGALNQSKHGRQLPPAVLESFAGIYDADKSIQTLKKDFGEKTGMFSFITKRLPYTSASHYQAVREGFIADITHKLYGSASSDSEKAAVRELVPDASTWDTTGEAMFEGLERLQADRVTRLKMYEAAGFDISPLYHAVRPTSAR